MNTFKYFSLTILLIFLFGVYAYSEENISKSNDTVNGIPDLENIIKKNGFNTYMNENEISNLSRNISYENKTLLFFKYEKNFNIVKLETLLNFVPTLGSWIIGDSTTALIFDCALLISGGVLLTGHLTSNTPLFYQGIGLSASAYILNLFIPSMNAALFNDKLRISLGINNEIKVSINNKNLINLQLLACVF